MNEDDILVLSHLIFACNLQIITSYFFLTKINKKIVKTIKIIGKNFVKQINVFGKKDKKLKAKKRLHQLKCKESKHRDQYYLTS